MNTLLFTSSHVIDTIKGPKITFKKHIKKDIWGCINCESTKCTHIYKNAFMTDNRHINLFVCTKCFSRLENINGWETIT
jgi:hypothetical protein